MTLRNQHPMTERIDRVAGILGLIQAARIQPVAIVEN